MNHKPKSILELIEIANSCNDLEELRDVLKYTVISLAVCKSEAELVQNRVNLTLAVTGIIAICAIALAFARMGGV